VSEFWDLKKFIYLDTDIPEFLKLDVNEVVLSLMAAFFIFAVIYEQLINKDFEGLFFRMFIAVIISHHFVPFVDSTIDSSFESGNAIIRKSAPNNELLRSIKQAHQSVESSFQNAMGKETTDPSQTTRQEQSFSDFLTMSSENPLFGWTKGMIGAIESLTLQALNAPFLFFITVIVGMGLFLTKLGYFLIVVLTKILSGFAALVFLIPRQGWAMNMILKGYLFTLFMPILVASLLVILGGVKELADINSSSSVQLGHLIVSFSVIFIMVFIPIATFFFFMKSDTSSFLKAVGAPLQYAGMKSISHLTNKIGGNQNTRDVEGRNLPDKDSTTHNDDRDNNFLERRAFNLQKIKNNQEKNKSSQNKPSNIKQEKKKENETHPLNERESKGKTYEDNNKYAHDNKNSKINSQISNKSGDHADSGSKNKIDHNTKETLTNNSNNESKLGLKTSTLKANVPKKHSHHKPEAKNTLTREVGASVKNVSGMGKTEPLLGDSRSSLSKQKRKEIISRRSTKEEKIKAINEMIKKLEEKEGDKS